MLTFFQVWPTFVSMTHFSKCDPFFQVWPILSSVTHFCKYEPPFFQVQFCIGDLFVLYLCERFHYFQLLSVAKISIFISTTEVLRTDITQWQSSVFSSVLMVSKLRWGPLYKPWFVDTLLDGASFRRLTSFNRTKIFAFAFKLHTKHFRINWSCLSTKTNIQKYNVHTVF